MERFTLGSLLASDGPAASVEPVDGAELADLLGWFRARCAELLVRCPPEAVPLRLPKDRVAGLLSCELGTLARLGGSSLAEANVRGRLTDLLVAQHVTVGSGGPAPADVEGDLRDALEASAAADVLAWIDEAGDEACSRLWGHAAVVRSGLERSWGQLDRAWWPRVQERVAVDVADGALVLAAQFDVVVGGPPTGRPMVVVEVKAGAASDRHRRDVLWYALVAALRHGRAPAMVAVWTAADDGLVPVPVAIGSVESAARRGLAALDRLVELAAGREPEVSPHPGCPWCPVLDRCDAGLASLPGAPAAVAALTDDDGPEWEPGPDEEPW